MEVRVEDDGRVSAMEDFGFDTLHLDPFPSPTEFIVLIRAVGLPEDFAEEADRTVEAYLLGPGMDPLVSIEFELPSGEPEEGHMEGWELWAMIPIFIQFTPHAEGTHSVELYAHGRVQPTSIPFHLHAGRPPAAA
jgi:hypothetical protein